MVGIGPTFSNHGHDQVLHFEYIYLGLAGQITVGGVSCLWTRFCLWGLFWLIDALQLIPRAGMPPTASGSHTFLEYVYIQLRKYF